MFLKFKIIKAIEHTPTFVDLYFIKASIYKHLYDFQQASESADYVLHLIFLFLN